MKRVVPTSVGCVLLALLPACGHHRSAYAVGASLNDNSCSYEATQNVAIVDATTGMAKLVGPGPLVSTCSGARVEWDVVQPTDLRLDVDETTPVPLSPHRFVVQARLLAGTRDLFVPWCGDYGYSLGADCAGIATLERADPHPTFCPMSAVVLGTAAGTCTVDATVLGLHTTRTLHLQ